MYQCCTYYWYIYHCFTCVATPTHERHTPCQYNPMGKRFVTASEFAHNYLRQRSLASAERAEDFPLDQMLQSFGFPLLLESGANKSTILAV